MKLTNKKTILVEVSRILQHELERSCHVPNNARVWLDEVDGDYVGLHVNVAVYFAVDEIGELVVTGDGKATVKVAKVATTSSTRAELEETLAKLQADMEDLT